MIWTKSMNSAVRIVKKELDAVTNLSKKVIVILSCNIIEELAKKNLIKKKED